MSSIATLLKQIDIDFKRYTSIHKATFESTRPIELSNLNKILNI